MVSNYDVVNWCRILQCAVSSATRLVLDVECVLVYGCLDAIWRQQHKQHWRNSMQVAMSQTLSIFSTILIFPKVHSSAAFQ